MKKQFFHLSTDVAELFVNHALNNFEALWDADIELVDVPNRKDSGWSEVGRLKVVDADGQEQCFYVKRQCNFNGRTLTNPFCTIPVALREWVSIQALNAIGIDTLEVACCARDNSIEDRALFVTKALDNYQNFTGWWQPVRTERQKSIVLQSMGRMIAKLHNAQYRHGCLYPKHIYIANENPEDVRMIDLETCRRIYSKTEALRDLDTLLRRQSVLSKEGEQQLLLAYIAASKANWTLESLQKAVFKRMAKKSGVL